ncbi:MAG: L,D-transpeptidase family protein [Archangium sp.]|nr:L,D-transpeptidase family protein [Archangium sp.]
MRLFLLLTLVATSALARDKVKEVRARRTADVKALVEKAGLTYPVDEVYLRGFKKDRQLELWAGRAGKPLVLVKTYPFCAASGELGPKRKEGDLQVPEGLYEVPSFNPYSDYHLSMKVSYPNDSDRVRSDAKRPGGLIYLHGNCASIGCIAIEDEPIEEVYLLAIDARRRPIRFDIFPTRLTAEGLASLEDDAANAAFWKELAPAYTAFEASKRPAAFTVSKKTGAYVLK